MNRVDEVRDLTGATHVELGERVQSLWSGYGEVRRARLDGQPVILKHVRPPAAAHPRKLRSYQVELCWYRDWSAACPARAPAFLGGWSDGRESLFVLEDLDAAGFAARSRWLTPGQVGLCLDWLAALHAAFLGRAPDGLWPIGTYWHLATRPDELRAMRDLDLKRRAPELDRRLNDARFQTLVHGDAKPANFCFRPDGLAVAGVDFQYIGGGVGVRDVAYLLGAWREIPGREAHLDRYFDRLRRALPADVGADVESEWRELLPVAAEDFQRFLDGWG